tara:strand:+ start:3708 stop:4085 length:378 start_codon:yes stop_codon:yes gene_type:complete
VEENFAYRYLLFGLGWICVVLGVIGALLPVVPTTPFLLVAAYCFSKSSPKVHSWLTRLPYFGNAIIDWETNKVIRPKAKVMSVFTIILIFGMSLGFAPINEYLKAMLVLIGLGCIVFILTRKSAP